MYVQQLYYKAITKMKSTQWLLQLRAKPVMRGAVDLSWFKASIRYGSESRIMVKLLKQLARATSATEHNTKPCHFFVLWLTLLLVHGWGGPALVSNSPGPNKKLGESVIRSKAFEELEIDWSMTHHLHQCTVSLLSWNIFCFYCC